MRKKHALIGLFPALALALSAGCESAPHASQDRVHTITGDAPAFVLVSDEQGDGNGVRLGAGDELGSALFDRYLASLEPTPTPAPEQRLADATRASRPLGLRAWIMSWLDTAS